MKLDSSAFIAEPELIGALRMRAVPVDCSSDRELFHQGEEPTGLYILDKGEATMSIEDPLGGVVVSMRVTSGSLLGLPGLIGNGAYSMTARVRKGAEVLFLSREEFSRLMLNEPQMAMMILKVLAAEVRTARMAIAGK